MLASVIKNRVALPWLCLSYLAISFSGTLVGLVKLGSVSFNPSLPGCPSIARNLPSPENMALPQTLGARGEHDVAFLVQI